MDKILDILIGTFGLAALLCLFFLAWGAPSGLLAITLVCSLVVVAVLLVVKRAMNSKSNESDSN